jgi:membrane protein DedA with SNARE-associated domain
VDWLSEWLIAFVQRENNPAGLALIAGSAAIEYIFPPFPGDTVTLFGAVLITAYGWSFAGVFGAVMAGSCAGSMLAFWAGQGLQRKRDRRPPKPDSKLDRMIVRFRRRGAVYLVLNRFFPGIRTLFFVAAGMARLPARAVLLYSAISAAVWNLGLIAIGATVGANFETLKAWVQRYTLLVWIGIGLALAFIGLRALLRRRNNHREPD